MSNPKRLHPIASVVTTGRRIRNLIIPMLAINFSGGREGIVSLLVTLAISLVAIIITLLTGILSWLRYTYRFEEDELRIEYGIFIRQKRYIPFERIQSINLTEGLLQRMFGLVKVQIETAGGGDEAEAVLSAITKEEARLIQEYVAQAKSGGDNEIKDVQEGQEVFTISTPELLVLSLTSGGVGVVISALFALFSQLDDFIPYKRIFGDMEEWAVQNIVTVAVVVFIVFFLAWVISLIITMLKYANFTVMKTEKDFIISQGLLEKKQMTIPLKRIQAIRINENFVRQLLGCGTVYVESAGGSSENEEAANVMILPIVKVKQIGTILASHLPDYIITSSFKTLPTRARRRYILRSWCITVPIVIAAIFFFKFWGLLSLILLGLGTGSALLKYRDAGWDLEQQQLTLRYRTITRTTIFMKKKRIQSLEMQESYFQKKRQLGTIAASVKSGAGGAGGTIVDMEIDDVHLVYEWFSREKQMEISG
ncbi:PH domain-containing protein [Neobacillus kokaensis]|uniref:UPF0699 transmembrane protein YdbT n=1 Tax=Neobacillus kokaensis TaxID=2759023 RepID=A0ABQ3NBM8_9BACI|nr:PH domain-containing protein [Neobacillus kokaensis]GHI01334.1 UPF0699 transmembrane protein YdbT [Neobacillus kokaensis]